MDICSICGKKREGKFICLEGEFEHVEEAFVCDLCSRIITMIAMDVVLSEISDNYTSKSMPSKSENHLTTEKDKKSTDPEKEILETPTETLAEEFLSFIKSFDLSETDDFLIDDISELFWETKGIDDKYLKPAKVRVKMNQVEKMAQKLIFEEVFSKSDDVLATELASFSKTIQGQENGQGVYVISHSQKFWKSHNISSLFMTIPIKYELRMRKIEKLAQELIDQEFYQWREKRFQEEYKNLPELASECVEWARKTGRKKIYLKDVHFFLREKRIQLLEETERALYFLVNNEI